MPYLKLEHVSVDIPLRGLSRQSSRDPRIVARPNGDVVVAALRDISLEFVAGERVGVVGSNGAGKTTLLRVMAGIIPISQGRMTVDGEVNGVFSLTDGIRFSLSGRENAHLRYYLLGEPGGSAEAFIEDAREFAELGEFFELPVSTYSPGMMSRLLFAMATYKSSSILLMDEWIGVADSSFQKKVVHRIDDFTNRSDILVVASHNREILRQVTERVVVLERGAIHCIRPSSENFV